MGKPPAYIFVVRHGTRLDAADKNWVQTSATPYDPPLTYGGWLQARATGARIANVLRSFRLPSPPDDRPPKRYKFAIHSSPFHRCVETSIAVAAGLSAPPDAPPIFSPPSRSNSAASDAARVASALRSAAAVPENAISDSPPPELAASPESDLLADKPVLRLDAFLGEWLTPDYFELITPPPPSKSMLATAKAALLRRQDHRSFPALNPWSSSNTTTTTTTTTDPSQQPIPPASSSPLPTTPRPRPADPASPKAGAGLERVTALAGTLPAGASPAAPASQPKPPAYSAPTPHFAISHAAGIPDGYVVHARDACLQVDYQWDSSTNLLDWGGGGTYGEEWPSMHKRFRRGIQSLVDWYSSADDPAAPVSNVSKVRPSADGHVEAETVVIIVSHGAGCNALIGAITHQPALMDVGMASLTMAVRKAPTGGPEDEPAVAGALAETDEMALVGYPDGKIPVHQYYDVEMVANTDHLVRSSSNASAARPASISNPWGGGGGSTRSRVNTVSSYSPVLAPFRYVDSGSAFASRSNSTSAAGSGGSSSNGLRLGALGGALPEIDTAAALRSGSMSIGSPSLGLWSPENARFSNEYEDDDDDYDDEFPDFDNKKIFAPRRKEKAAAAATAPRGLVLDPGSSASLPSVSSAPLRDGLHTVTTAHLGAGAGGLWGGPREGAEKGWSVE